ncbi:hypothetical protein [Streptomyces sp. NPDC020965]|uniref:hypothetical protein n=1 Tax=Streptomyces sp. NPDC020965 TaxID=3365105 RepID=UPI00378B5F7E
MDPTGWTALPGTRETRRTESTSSQRGTETVRSWYFALNLQEPLTSEQSDTVDHLDRFNDGRIGVEEGPGWTKFTCLFDAETLTDAIAEALNFFEDLPGVLIRSVEIDHFDIRANGMSTPAVVPAPPPVGTVPAVS